MHPGDTLRRGIALKYCTRARSRVCVRDDTGTEPSVVFPSHRFLFSVLRPYRAPLPLSVRRFSSTLFSPYCPFPSSILSHPLSSPFPAPSPAPLAPPAYRLTASQRLKSSRLRVVGISRRPVHFSRMISSGENKHAPTDTRALLGGGSLAVH